MKKIIFIFLNLVLSLSTVNAQKGIDFKVNYAAGGKMLMNIDSSAKNVSYALGFPNQPFTAFNFLPDVHNVSIQIYFRKKDIVENYRYTILKNNKPVVVNKSINKAQLKDSNIGDDEIFRSTTFGTFPIKDKIITIMMYDIQNPQNVYKTVFYGKQIPKAKILSFSKRFKMDKGVFYRWIKDPNERTIVTLTEKEDELTIVKEISDIDYLYYTTIKDKQTNKIIFESTVWQYGGVISDENVPLPNITIAKNIFKKSGDYEIIIQPRIKQNISSKEFEKYITKYTLRVTLDDEKLFSEKQVISYGIIWSVIVGGVIGGITVLIMNRRKVKKVAAEAKQKEIAQLQLNSVRSQLNPHFLFNALAGIQNLMNKNEIDNANRYLSKFARLTRNVLDSKDLISLTEETTLLDDYLQMEQLRFGFQYTLSASTDLDTENIEIPAMLLQPFVENAVKHGIAENGNVGIITVGFEKQSSNLILSIKDNGKGFDANKTYNGLGLALSKNRIALLNTIYKNTPFVLDIQSNTNGTLVTITLTQWL